MEIILSFIWLLDGVIGKAFAVVAITINVIGGPFVIVFIGLQIKNLWQYDKKGTALIYTLLLMNTLLGIIVFVAPAPLSVENWPLTVALIVLCTNISLIVGVFPTIFTVVGYFEMKPEHRDLRKSFMGEVEMMERLIRRSITE